MKYEICADIIRKSFNYGFTHTAIVSNTPGALKALVDRYTLTAMDFRLGVNKVHFTKKNDLNYSIVIFGSEHDLVQLIDFLKNPVECECEPIEIETHTVSVGDFY